ncbi:MAG TPA: hypothetical protein ENI86_10150 [Acidimicrobiales bacterium]|nr:hypothetical protein [Acidimicrobiales bacterium]
MGLSPLPRFRLLTLAVLLLLGACAGGDSLSSGDSVGLTYRVEGGISGSLQAELAIAPDGVGSWTAGGETVVLVVSRSLLDDTVARLRAQGLGRITPTPPDPNLADGLTVTITAGNDSISWYGITEQRDRFRPDEISLLETAEGLFSLVTGASPVTAATPGPDEKGIRGFVARADDGSLLLCSSPPVQGRCEGNSVALVDLDEGVAAKLESTVGNDPAIVIGEITDEGLNLS